jgi:hypothetical protein
MLVFVQLLLGKRDAKQLPGGRERDLADLVLLRDAN